MANTSELNVEVSPVIPVFISFNLFVKVPTCPLTVEVPNRFRVPVLFEAVIIAEFISLLSARFTLPSALYLRFVPVKLPFRFTLPVPSTSRFVANTSELNVELPFPVLTSANFTPVVPILPVTVCVPPTSVKIPFPSSAVVIVDVIFLPLANFNSELAVVPLFKTVLFA